MMELILITLGIGAGAVIVIYFGVGGGTTRLADEEERKSVEHETPTEMKENLGEFEEEAKEYQEKNFPPESDWGVGND
jgi:hypothetical protein